MAGVIDRDFDRDLLSFVYPLSDPNTPDSEYNREYQRQLETPEEQLVYYCILHALDDAKNGLSAPIRARAERWLLRETRPKDPFSFHWCCNTLAINADKFRAKLLNKWPKLKIKVFWDTKKL